MREIQEKLPENKEKNEISERQLVGGLILQVLSGNICVRQALEQFPSPINDDSLQCAWHALIHLEADEDFREKDAVYAQEQNNYLETMAHTLQKGEALPKNILEEYNKYYSKVIKSKTENLLSKIKSVFRFII